MATETSIRSSESGGNLKSNEGKCSVAAAEGSSNRGKNGTSVTTTSTERSQLTPSTEKRTGRPRRTQSQEETTGTPGSGDHSVTSAVLRDLAAMPSDLANSGLAMLALALAAEIDGHNSATSKSMCAGQLRDTLDRLRELMPAKEEADGIDDLVARRAFRLAGKSAS